LEKLPEEMAALEIKITEYEKSLSDPDLYSKNPKRFEEVSEALQKAQNQLSAAEEEWLELEMLKEELET